MALLQAPLARRALSAQADSRLLRLLRAGHAEAFDEIVGRYRAPLVAFATPIAPAGMAEDVVQDALLRAHRSLLADEREIEVRPWLFAIVRNGALNARRGEREHEELDLDCDGVPQPPDIAARRTEFRALVTAICALPQAQREALVKRELEGLGHGEIARGLGTTPVAVRGLIYRARTALRNSAGALVPLPLLRYLLGPDAVQAAGASLAPGSSLGAGMTIKAAIATTAVVAVGGAAINAGPSSKDPVDAARGAPLSGWTDGAATAAAQPLPASSSSLNAVGGNGNGFPSGRQHGPKLDEAQGHSEGEDDRPLGSGVNDDQGAEGGDGGSAAEADDQAEQTSGDERSASDLDDGVDRATATAPADKAEADDPAEDPEPAAGEEGAPGENNS